MLDYESMKGRFAASRFRSCFALTRADRARLAFLGWAAVRSQAEAIVRSRLADAFPTNDGRQTPMRGCAIFTAQHATATCCRGCLAKWHGIPAGRALTEAEIMQVTEMIIGWLRDRAGDLTEFPQTPDLFG